MAALRASGNLTWATPLNETESADSSQNSNTTLLPALKSFTTSPLNNSTLHPLSPASSTTSYDPSTITFYSFTYSFASYTVLLLLLVTAIICIKMGISRRKELQERAEAQRRTALQQAQSAHIPTTSDNNSRNSNNPASAHAKNLDLPPTYEDVVKSYALQKQQEPAVEMAQIGNTTGFTTNPSSNSLATAVSTLTIETEISNSNSVVAVHLSNPTNT